MPFLALSLMALAVAQDKHRRIGEIEFYGYAGLDLDKIRAALALVSASRDSQDTVRNNAIRALAVLARSNPKVAARIPADHFIAMLSSGFWTDRNKGGSLLEVEPAARSKAS